jgi:hypothetical protein
MSSALLGARLLLSAVFLVAALAKHVHLDSGAGAHPGHSSWPQGRTNT